MTDDYIEFINNVKKRLSIDLTMYKQTQMKRRLVSLRDKRGYPTFRQYFCAMKRDNLLLNEFLDHMTINVSEFFRNPDRWEVLKTSILPQLGALSNKLKIWSAACSTGEEPYSTAIMLKEFFPNYDFHILATDIDRSALEKARQGVYTERSVKGIPDKLIYKYFKQDENLYSVDQSVKQHVAFKKHDLLADTYPSNVDLIICRNVLIYFTDDAKAAIYTKFSHSLNQHGVIFIGSTEQIFKPDNYGLRLLDTFFYQRMT
ncbi:CheR family methyltransferase [Lentibacillus cibarius]|uniref:Protein-glutamate O-methyltransferase CheR n=1 Tax=Lentibacillus cibarius TaxID=2583219 RepID=A0A5S3QG29_9BACI|nr:protein-glutamate O-methyltransferase CheR [Lentibacillus cibarius]TMN20679.1 protein-glutamate O-methyltransferase CheR [Lentibacillus cibarius]